MTDGQQLLMQIWLQGVQSLLAPNEKFLISKTWREEPERAYLQKRELSYSLSERRYFLAVNVHIHILVLCLGVGFLVGHSLWTWDKAEKGH